MYAQTSHAGDSRPPTCDARANLRAGRRATPASALRVVSARYAHGHANEGDRAPYNHRQASAA